MRCYGNDRSINVPMHRTCDIICWAVYAKESQHKLLGDCNEKLGSETIYNSIDNESIIDAWHQQELEDKTEEIEKLETKYSARTFHDNFHIYFCLIISFHALC